jgi:hypothetical protein
MHCLVQKITFRAQPEFVFAEMVKWQDADWWPDIPMKFVRLPQKDQEGALYLQRAEVPFGPQWHTRVSCVDRQKWYVRREFMDGMFKGGREELSLRQNNSSLEVAYQFCYQIRSPLQRILWNVLFQHLHRRNINTILHALKAYIEERGR